MSNNSDKNKVVESKEHKRSADQENKSTRSLIDSPAMDESISIVNE